MVVSMREAGPHEDRPAARSSSIRRVTSKMQISSNLFSVFKALMDDVNGTGLRG